MLYYYELGGKLSVRIQCFIYCIAIGCLYLYFASTVKSTVLIIPCQAIGAFFTMLTLYILRCRFKVKHIKIQTHNIPKQLMLTFIAGLALRIFQLFKMTFYFSGSRSVSFDKGQMHIYSSQFGRYASEAACFFFQYAQRTHEACTLIFTRFF